VISYFSIAGEHREVKTCSYIQKQLIFSTEDAVNEVMNLTMKARGRHFLLVFFQDP